MPRKVLESFNVSYLQVLDADGHLDRDLEPILPPETLRLLYRSMVLARQLDLRMLSLQRQGRIGTFAPLTGQEAAQVGSAFALEPTDWMVPGFREAAAYIVRGLPLHSILLENVAPGQFSGRPGRCTPLPWLGTAASNNLIVATALPRTLSPLF
jgi:pyruvate dehydrogenase E1 component alpha subunit